MPAALAHRSGRMRTSCCSPGAASSGRGGEALGLVTAVADDPEAAALAWFKEHLARQERRGARLRRGAGARLDYVERVERKLADVERSISTAHARPATRKEGLSRLPRQARAAHGSTADDAPPLARSSPAARRCSRTSISPVQEWKAAAPGRKAIGYMPFYVPRELDPCRGRAAAGHPRRRRPARSHPGRRLLPELHLPHPALDHRARRHRPARLSSTACCFPVDLRRHPQPLGHVADHVPEGEVAAISTCRRTTSTTIGGAFYVNELDELRDDAGRDARPPDRRDADPAPRSRVYNENRRRGARALCLPRQATLAGARRRGLSADARRHGAARSRSTTGLSASISPPPLRSSGRGATTPASCVTGVVLRAAAARPDQVDRDGGLLHRRRRLHAGDPLGRSTTCRRTGDPIRNLALAYLAPTRRRPPPSTTRARRRRACSSSKP